MALLFCSIRFAVAVSNGSVNLTEGFPYIRSFMLDETGSVLLIISQCGTYNPQSCLFAQICNICSVLELISYYILNGLIIHLHISCPLLSPSLFLSALFIVVIRFQQVKDFGNHGKANIFSIVLGFLSSVGISIIGNFQQSVLMKIHLLGALLAFFLGLAYFWVQLFLTYRAQPSQDRCYVGPARATCCTLCTILVIVMSILHNTGHSSGAAMCEWALVMLFFCLFGLFATEFRHIDCHQLTVQKQSLENDCSRATVEFNGYVTNASS
ncbi:hypothetical protein L3Q82_014399 [Scortum barcoo]|uniref:Uncharacterized protein n=1 Tax=Scortum barcoo TaxID=214431 RepID=A0ACB8VWV6_9TELE|nr:hypothetical protein L3Q82_014399 [Scortum barcoo]